jgi:hypothetical protein
LTFSFLNSLVSKSSEVRGLIAGIDTILAPRADPPTKPGVVTLRAFRSFETDVAKPRLKGFETGFRIFEIDDDGVERAGENVEAAICEIRKERRRQSNRK